MVDDKARGLVALLGGMVLVFLGVLFLMAQGLHIDLWGSIWPLFVVLPGALLFAGMVSGGKSSAPLAIPASIVTMVGLILLYQNTFNHWASWAYAWALIFPTSIGIGLYIQGIWGDQPATRQYGVRLTIIGACIFLAFAVFFELIIGISGFGIGRIFWPLALIVLGGYLLLRRSPRSKP